MTSRGICRVFQNRLRGQAVSQTATIPVGVTNRHFHISREHLDTLYGPGYELTVLRQISQRGQFAARETLAVEGPRGRIDAIRIVGPVRQQTQLEIAPSDARVLGVSPPVRYSGDLAGSAGGRIIGPRGVVEISAGIIIPQRHIHADPEAAARLGLANGDRVYTAPVREGPVRPGSESRDVIFTNVLVRVDPTFVLDFHIDVDEANAAGLESGDRVSIAGRPKRARGRWITERDVWQAILQKKKIRLHADSRLTPAARDLGRAHRIFEERS